MSHDYDVIIIGAGPTGLIAANLLGTYDVKTLVLERDPSTSEIPKAIMIDDEGLRVCQTVGLTNEVNKIITVGGGANYYAKDKTKPYMTVKPGRGELGFYPRNKFLQNEFEQVLLKGLDRFPHVEVRFNMTFESFEQKNETVIAKLEDGTQFSARYLFGADGGRSTVRRQLGIKMRDIGNKKDGSSFEEPWIILDLANDDVKTRHTSFYCDPPRPWMNAATAKGQRRYEFMLLPGEDEEEMLKDEVLAELVAPVTQYKSENVVKKAVVTFNALVAETWQEGNVIIMGDAAHMTPPFAGQGLNAGLRDAYNISWKVASVIKGLADPSIVDSYEKERIDNAEAMIKLAVQMGNFILTTSYKRKLFRDLTFGMSRFIPPLKRYITEMRFKPKPASNDGVFIDMEKDELIGKMIKQPEVMTEDLELELLDYSLGSGFALLKIGDPDLMAFPDVESGVWKNLDVKKVTVYPEDDLPHPIEGETVVSDINGAFRDYLGQFILVRPDRYVGGVFSESEFPDFTKKLEKFFLTAKEEIKKAI